MNDEDYAFADEFLKRVNARSQKVDSTDILPRSKAGNLAYITGVLDNLETIGAIRQRDKTLATYLYTWDANGKPKGHVLRTYVLGEIGLDAIKSSLKEVLEKRQRRDEAESSLIEKQASSHEELVELARRSASAARDSADAAKTANDKAESSSKWSRASAIAAIIAAIAALLTWWLPRTPQL